MYTYIDCSRELSGTELRQSFVTMSSEHSASEDEQAQMMKMLRQKESCYAGGHCQGEVKNEIASLR